jgi:hypothetical protein
MWCTMKSAVPRAMGIMATLPATATTSPPKAGLTPASCIGEQWHPPPPSMETLDPLGKDGLKLNRRVREHVLGTTQGPHGVVVDVQPKAMEAQEIQTQFKWEMMASRDRSMRSRAGCPYSYGGIIVAHHEDGCVSTCPHNQKAANPHVVGKQGQLGGVIRRNVRIGGHRIHVVSHDDGQGTQDGQVHCQLSMPRSGQVSYRPSWPSPVNGSPL